MTDVRLTATTPDGEVVPLLANAKGEMLLEAPIAPPEFDGNLDGDLTVSGSASFDGDVSVGDNTTGSVAFDKNGTYLGKEGYISLYKTQADTSSGFFTGRRFGTTAPLFGIDATGSASFAGTVTGNSNNAATIGGIFKSNSADETVPAIQARNFDDAGDVVQGRKADGAITSSIKASGAATFVGDVVIGSRGSKWLIRESNGVAMLVEQATRQPRIEKVRDLPRELDLIEAALNEVMEKLKMTPPAGWEVWDGDQSQ